MATPLRQHSRRDDTSPFLEYLLASMRAQGLRRIQSAIDSYVGLSPRQLAVAIHKTIRRVHPFCHGTRDGDVRSSTQKDTYKMGSMVVVLVLLCQPSFGDTRRGRGNMSLAPCLTQRKGRKYTNVET